MHGCQKGEYDDTIQELERMLRHGGLVVPPA
jgi:hypothetical protein